MRALVWLLISSGLYWSIACQRLELDRHHPVVSAAPAVASTRSPVLALGQTAVLPAYRIKLVSQRDCATANARMSQTATRSWAAELEVTNTSTKRIAASPFYATLQDDERYSYTTTLTGCGTLLPAKLLDPSETIRGYVPYALPYTTPNATLSYRPMLRGNVIEEARFHVEF